MKLVHVIPIARGIQKDTLSYFSADDHPHGALVSVPLRKKNIPAIVVGSEEVRNVKAKLKSNDFAMKKVTSRKTKEVFIPGFIEAAGVAADYFSSSLGAVLHQIVPKILLENIDAIPALKIPKKPDSEALSVEILGLQGEQKHRFDDYKRLVRESFARDKSTYILSPTIRHAEYVAEKLNKGIESYVYVLHNDLPKKEILKRIKAILKEKHPVLIVGTGSFLCLPRVDVGTLIVEHEHAKSYKMQSRPYVDYRIFARLYAQALGIRVIYADMPLSIETAWRLKQREYDELGSTRARVATEADQYIMDMRPPKDAEKKEFFVLSSELVDQIEKTTGTQQKTFIFNVRRGLAPTTVCEECGTVVTCKLCHAAVVLHTSSAGNVFVCHACGESRSAKERCTNCNSWKLKALGIGSARIKDELVSKFGPKRVFIIDSDTTKTYKQAAKEVERFYKTDGAILIGTELSLSFLQDPVSISAIASIDSLLSLPDPKMYENIFSLVLKVRSLATDAFFLQTRQPELSLIKEAVSGDVGKFYQGEILNRKRFDYPPFTTLIKISSYGTVAQITKEMDLIEKELSDYPFSIYPAFNRIGPNKFVLSGLLKIKEDTWPNKKLLNILRSFPPNISVNVSPESTL